MSRFTFLLLVLGTAASLLGLAAVLSSAGEILYIGQVSIAADTELVVAGQHGYWVKIPVVGILLFSVLFPVWAARHWRRERDARLNPDTRDPVTYDASDRAYNAGLAWMLTAVIAAALYMGDGRPGIAGWVVCAGAAAIGLSKARRARRLGRMLRRRSQCLCAACGYDMRATPSRCPECGATAHARAGPGGSS